MQDVKWLQTITSLPILVKGVLTAEDSKQNKTCLIILLIHSFRYSIVLKRSYHIEEIIQCVDVNFAARLAVQSGAAGIIVSNHGARQLDYVPATISALEEACSY